MPARLIASIRRSPTWASRTDPFRVIVVMSTSQSRLPAEWRPCGTREEPTRAIRFYNEKCFQPTDESNKARDVPNYGIWPESRPWCRMAERCFDGGTVLSQPDHFSPTGLWAMVRDQ